jgi:Ca-activated chloride channel family protein
MTFESPLGLLMLIVLIPLVLLIVRRERARVRRLESIGDPALVASLADATARGLRYAKHGMWLAALALLIVALARPVWGTEVEVIETRGTSLVFVLDVSASMDAQDVTPSRLVRAQLAIEDIIRSGAGSQFALVIFAGDAILQFPLTPDADSAITFVRAATSESISRQGTAIGDALQAGLDAFDTRIGDERIMILMSDGENHSGNPEAVALDAAERGVTIYAIGYGTPDGDVVPVFDDAGEVIAFKNDRAGGLVISRLDEAVLEQIAELTGGTYKRATDSGVETADLLNRIGEASAANFEARLRTRGVARFGVLVAAAVILAAVEMLLPVSRKVGT